MKHKSLMVSSSNLFTYYWCLFAVYHHNDNYDNEITFFLDVQVAISCVSDFCIGVNFFRHETPSYKPTTVVKVKRPAPGLFLACLSTSCRCLA